jgi:hypothetical protein
MGAGLFPIHMLGAPSSSETHSSPVQHVPRKFKNAEITSGRFFDHSKVKSVLTGGLQPYAPVL